MQTNECTASQVKWHQSSSSSTWKPDSSVFTGQISGRFLYQQININLGKKVLYLHFLSQLCDSVWETLPKTFVSNNRNVSTKKSFLSPNTEKENPLLCYLKREGKCLSNLLSTVTCKLVTVGVELYLSRRGCNCFSTFICFHRPLLISQCHPCHCHCVHITYTLWGL